MALDKRINAFRPDLAAAHLKGKVEAERFVEGEEASVCIGRASLRTSPFDEASQDTELLYGERVTVYDREGDWAWVQAVNDGYVGYVKTNALSEPFITEFRIADVMMPVFTGPLIKKPVRDLLPLNAEVNALCTNGDHLAIADGAWVYRKCLALPTEWDIDFVAVAERFLGVPYVWGGKTFAGLDCSGLIQTAMRAAGVQVPRDTDMQEKFFTVDADAPRRGDLVFWKGHVGVMLDAARLLHANVFHMAVAIETLAQAQARIAKTPAGPITSVKRPR